jgi:hypothetical protein
VFCSNVAVIGDQGLPIRTDAVAPGQLAGGYYASDMIFHAVTRYAPTLQASYAPSVASGAASATIQQSGFVVPHASFLERTTAGEIVRQLARFGLQDWAVWDDKTFWFHDRGARGRKWRARVEQTHLEETGPQAERLWNSVIVQYQDVDGTTVTAGPPGSGSSVVDGSLFDPDPDNPANKLGITRRALLTISTALPQQAIQLGRRFLEEQKLLDSSGRASIVGHIESDRGVLFPYWAVRAGDYISFTNASDTSYRRIVRTDKDSSTYTCSVDLDSPPEGLQSLLERLGAGLSDLSL